MRIIFFASLFTCSVISGCGYFPESCFDLSQYSKLPNWFSLPDGASRENISVEMCYYLDDKGRTANFVMRDERNSKRTKVIGQLEGLYPLISKTSPSFEAEPRYPSYEIIRAGGVVDVIEHRRMEPIFYVSHDPAVWAELKVQQ